ncbi:MAG: rnpA [Betaproteobacteria bacterium]|nr:rnpA [Betaproteobacteria bacterium]
MFAYKCSVAGKFFQVYAKPSSRAEPRLGVTVNKRFVPRATARNYCKRLARETFRVNSRFFYGVDLVVRLRSDIAANATAQARTEILSLMRRVYQLCGDATDAAPKS